MSRGAEVEALRVVQGAYERWADASRQLDEKMSEAAAQEASPPVGALRADFAAQLEVTRAVIAFAQVCPAEGPDLGDLPGAAFVLAMYKAVTPRLHGELDALMQDWEEWLPAVGRWTPATGEAPLPRPVSPAHSRVLSTVEAWYEFVQDRTRDVVVKMFADAGGEVEEMIHVRADGQLVEHARITFPKPASAPAPDRREGGLWARLRGWFG